MQNKKIVTAAIQRRGPRRGRALACANAGLLAVILACAFAVIHSSHGCRELYTRLQGLESAQWHLQEEYGRLLLEQSTWASHYRVESVARGELGMQAPDPTLLEVLPQ